MLLAFENFREKINVPFKMIIVGEKMFMTSDIEQVYSSMQYSNDVLFVGRKSPLELKFLLGSATALSFVPLFEGFGIPVVEAMYCDVPVIASNVTSLPEIAGEAAIYADPCNVDSIADAMLKIVENISLRQKIIEAARSQKLKYSWDKTAASLWSGITKCFD
jgi:glycosyltransferase involved in cell wall biosynthesis